MTVTKFQKLLHKEIDETRRQRNLRTTSSEGWLVLNARLDTLCDCLDATKGKGFYYTRE